jgi:hypothetical protein
LIFFRRCEWWLLSIGLWIATDKEMATGPGESRVTLRNNPLYLGAVCAALVACGAKDPQAGKPAAAAQANSDIVVGRKLSEIAAQANQAAPAAIDEFTRLDGATAGPGLTLTTRYTLVNPADQGINSETFGTKLTPVVKEGSCKNPDLRPLIDRGATVVLEYRGLDGKPIGTISINRDTCNAPAAPAAPAAKN